MPLIPGLINLFQSIQDPDKDKREAALRYYTANPDKYQSLVDSNISDNPQMLQALFGQNARFGGNNNILDTLRNNIQSSPLSEQALIQRKAQLGQTPLNDISNASKSIPQLRGTNVSTLDASQIGQGPEALLTSQQKDVRRKFLGLGTQQEDKNAELLQKEREGSIDLNKQQLKNAELSNTALGQEISGRSQAAADKEEKDARETIARKYLLQNKLTPYKGFLNKATPDEVRQGIFSSDDLKKQFDAEQEDMLRKSALALQKESTSGKHDLDFLIQQHRVNFATAVGTKYGADPGEVLQAMKLGGDLSKYLDTKFHPTTPDDAGLQRGAIALNNAREKFPAEQAKAMYNDFTKDNEFRFRELNGKTNLDPAHIQSIVDQINQDARARFGALGIKAPQWAYGKEGDKKSKYIKDNVLYTIDPGDELLGLSFSDGKGKDKPDTKSDTTTTVSDDAMANRILQEAKAGNISLDETLKDTRLSPSVRKLILQNRGKK